ncbi:MAG: glycoside hydrolase family 2 protein [Bacteroidales bacterium]|nr:glycoside hydrolase family 2 protein [Bacteroidales bacterium]
MNRKNLSLFRLVPILLLAISCGQAQTSQSFDLQWPEISSQTRPWTRWWWPGSAVQESDIVSMLDAYSQAGLGGMEVTTIYGAKGWEDRYRDYLSDEWMDLFCFTLKEAASRDLGVDLANASGWPFGGPWVDPEDACRYLAHKEYFLHGGERVTEPVEYIQEPMVRTLGLSRSIDEVAFPITENDSLQQIAFEQVRYPVPLPLLAVTANGPDGQYLDLTDRVEDGVLDWTAPEGDWTVCALFLGWHGKMVERAGPGGEGDVIDHFSARTITNYLERFDEAFQGRDVSHIRYYFNDSYEVDDARGSSDWTEDFFDEFRARRGYDLRAHMPDLLGIGDDAETARRVLFDYRTTIGELLLENYSTLWQKWAAAQGKGIRNQAHGSPANILDLYAVSDVPETEGRSIVGMKTASSAAHVTAHLLVSSESATWLNEHFLSTLDDVKNALDVYFLAGVNHIFYHGTCLSPDDAPWPGWLFYAAVHFQPTNPNWKDFAALNEYVARCQSFLQAGQPDNDLLLFFDATDLLNERGRELLYHMSQTTAETSAIGRYASDLYRRGYTWDYVTDRMIVNNLDVRDGRIVNGHGASYQALVLPRCQEILPETFAQIVRLARRGATILIEGGLPQDVPGLGRLDAGRKTLERLTSSLNFARLGDFRLARTGRGRILVGDNLDQLLDAVGVSREKMYDLGLQCISRRLDDGGVVYFVRNSSREAVRGWIPLDVAAAAADLYDPMSGKIGAAQIRHGADGTEVWMALQPGGSLLVRTGDAPAVGASEPYPFYDVCAAPTPLPGPWTVSFVEGGPTLPAERSVSRLESWTAWGPEYARFSGTAEYVTTLPPQPGENPVLLDLGEVDCSASVTLDGEPLGTLFTRPFTLVLTPAQAARGGRLCIRVSNLMANRISWMDREGQLWRIFYNANIQARLPQDRGSDGWFTAAGWQPLPSGLVGPVSVAPLAAQTAD